MTFGDKLVQFLEMDFFYLVGFLGQAQLCSGPTTGSALKNHP